MILDNKKLFFILTLFFGFNHLQSMNFGKSFFAAPSNFRPASVESVAGSRLQLAFGEQGNRQQFGITPFGGQMINNKRLTKYLLPYGGAGYKNTLVAGGLGSAAAINGTVDLLSKYFNVITNTLPDDSDAFDKSDFVFQSNLKFNPSHKYAGVNLSYRYHLSEYTDKGYWLEVSAPFVWIENDMGMTEEIINKGSGTAPSGYFSSMKAAFKQKDWNYGKIDGPKSRAGISDIKLKAGYVYAKERHYFLNSYFGAIAPTGNKPTCEYMFEPVVGNNGHMGVFSGGAAGVRIWAKCDKYLYWMFDTCGTFLFANNQLRSIDLQGRPWSRYLGVYISKDATKINPGINSFTLPVQVSVGSERDLNTSFVYKQGGFHAEAGYHFYSRQSEELCLLHSLGSTLAVASDVDSSGDYIDPADSGRTLYSKNYASINRYLKVNNDKNASGSETYTALSDADLDLNSAAHPAVISHTMYGVVGYHFQNSANPAFVGLGAAWETSNDASAMNKISFWGKIEVSI